MIRQIYKKGKWHIITVGVTLMMTVSVLVGYTRINIQRFYEQNIKVMQESSSETVKVMEHFFEYGESSLALVANMAGNSIEQQEFDENKLKEWKKNTPFDYMEYIDSNGIEIVEYGYNTGEMNELCFWEGMKGKAGVDVSFGKKNRDEGLVIFYEPVIVDGKVVGVIFGNFFQSHLERLMSTYNSTTDIKEYICLSDGTVAASTDIEAEENIFNMLQKKYDFEEKQVAEMKEVIKTSGTYSFDYSSKVKTSNAFINGMNVNGWSVVMITPVEKNQVILNRVRQEAVIVGVLIVTLFNIYVSLVVLKHQKERNNFLLENEKLQNAVSYTNQAARVYEKALQTTAVAFEEIYVIDVQKNTLETIFPEKNRGKVNDYEYVIDTHFKEGVIMEDSEEGIREFLSFEGIYKNLATQDYVEKKYKRNVKERGVIWCLTSFIVMERENGVPKTVTMAIRSVHELMLQEERQKELLNIAVQCAEAANHAKTEFLSKMSHDFRTPMNAIIGMTAIAEANMDNKEKVKECLKKIETSGKHLLSLANKVLDVSKIDSGKMTLSNEIFDIVDVLEDSLNMLRTDANEKQHTLTLYKEIEEKAVVGDRVSLEQIFVNLLSNAVKYTPNGGNINVYATQKEEGTSGHITYEFIVEDDGIGMEPEFLEKLYNPFERVEDLRISKNQGAGLGMAIVRSTVQLLNGKIDVESELGRGTKFTILIPFMPQSSKLIHEDTKGLDGEKAFAVLESKDYSNKKVLLVEDNEINSEIAVEILKTTKLEVDVAEDGKKAVDILCTCKPGTYDLVFMDIRMPVMDGYEATRTIRSMGRKDLQEIPIVAMTADAFAEDVQSAKTAGMNGHIAKPLDIDVIVAELEKWL